jgi:hypothetical protein
VQADEFYSPHNISSAESGQAAFSTAAEKHKADTPLELDANASTKPDVPRRDPSDTLLQPNSHIQAKFQPEDARALPMPYSEDVRSALRALLKAQEDSLCATKQLLAMCSASAEPDRALTTLHTRSTNVSVDSLYSNEHRRSCFLLSRGGHPQALECNISTAAIEGLRVYGAQTRKCNSDQMFDMPKGGQCAAPRATCFDALHCQYISKGSRYKA